MRLVLLVIIITFAKMTLGQDSLAAKIYLNGKVQISSPGSWKEMDKESIADKFPDPNSRPSVILTDKEELTSLKIIEMPEDVADNEIAQYKEFRVSHMKKETNLQWLGDGIKKINGKSVGFIKVIYTDKKTFAYFTFTSLKGKLLLLTYSCAEKLWPSMQDTVEKIFNSLKVD